LKWDGEQDTEEYKKKSEEQRRESFAFCYGEGVRQRLENKDKDANELYEKHDSYELRGDSLLEEGNCTNDVSTAIAIDREILSISDTIEKKTNNNTIRVNEVKNILKVTSPALHTKYNNTNNISTYDNGKKYLNTVDRNKDQKNATYYLPEFLRANEKHTIQDRSTLLNTVHSTSEDVDLPHKRYSSK